MQSSANPFRSQWLYRRLPAGDAMLAAEKGLSPAFLKLLAAVDGDSPVSFSTLETRFGHLDADDLELWLAELCGMRLIVPAQSSADTQAAQPATEAPDELSAAAEAFAWPDVLLVHKLRSTRQAWRDMLAPLPLRIHEAGTLEEADAAYNSVRPAGVVIGPEGGDFNALNLIHALKHPRAPRLTKVILMLDEKSYSPKIKSAAARADDTVTPEAWDSLPERIARQLSLPKAALSASQPLQLAEDGGVPPDHLRHGLEQEHPRVAAVIADQWGKASLDDLFDEMIFDTRGEADSFSHQAMEDLMFLYRMHRELRPRDDAWRANSPRGRRARIAALRATSRLRALAPGAQRQVN